MMSEQNVPRSVEQRIVIKFLGENIPSAEIHHRLQQYGEECLLRAYVCVRVYVCARVCVCSCVCMCVSVSVRVRLSACLFAFVYVYLRV